MPKLCSKMPKLILKKSKLISEKQKLISESQKLISKLPKLISKSPKLISAGFHLSGLDWISHKKKPDYREGCIPANAMFSTVDSFLILESFCR